MNKTNFDFDHFRAQAESFISNLTTEIVDLGIPVHSLPCDHICFRVGTAEEYEYYKAIFSNYGQLLTEAQVNGRPICTFRLNSPFQTAHHQVSLIELPAPKPGANYSTGFEHCEFVIKECFKTFSSKFPKLNFTEGGNPILNPELCLKLKEGRQAKFHHLSLDRVIELEEARIQDIIFDFDGTLIKSRETIYEINRVVFSNILGREISLQESIEKFHSDFPTLFETFGVTSPIKITEGISNWGSVSETFSYDLFDGVLETLELLKNKGFKLHLWTARDESSARKILKDHNLERFFETFSFATPKDSKPHANSLSFDWKAGGKHQVIVIGDSPSDVIGAKNISAIGGAALWDVHSKKNSLIANGAELFFHRLSDFTKWLSPSGKPID